jgi:uncharacterized membrane protein
MRSPRPNVVARGRRLIVIAGLLLPATASAAAVSDTEALAIVRKHCVMCHAEKPTHPAFQGAPNNVRLETVGDLKRHAKAVYAQTVRNKAMPLGNRTGMTDAERAALGRWIEALP